MALINEAAESYESTRWIGISACPSTLLTLEQDTEFFRFFDTIKNYMNNLKDKNVIANLPEELKLMVMFFIDFTNLLYELKKCYIGYNIPHKNGIEENGKVLAWPLFDDEYVKEIDQIFKEEL